jgi:hypothetical protein
MIPHGGPPTLVSGLLITLLFGAVGFGFVNVGVKAISNREIETGRKRSRYHTTVHGKNAILTGVGAVLFGLYWVVQGALEFAKFYQAQ